MTKKYGSFDITMKNEEGEEYTHTVPPLSQHELAGGWRLVLPKRKMVTVIMKNKEGNEESVRKFNDSYFKINLAQLPPYLFHRLRKCYKGGQFTHYQVRDKCYVYLVQPTPVDKEIFKMADYCNRFEYCVSHLNDEQRVEVRRCLEVVNEKEIKGWVVMKSNRLFNNI